MTDHELRCIRSYLQERRQDMVDLLQRLALAESPSDKPAAVAQVLALLVTWTVAAFGRLVLMSRQQVSATGAR